MTKRVGVPGALAEQRGRGKRRGRFPAAKQGEKRPRNRLLSSRGSSNGRTPALTSEEMSVRIRRPEPSNLVGRRRWSGAGPDQKPRDRAPKLMTTLVYIADSTLFRQSPASGRSTSMDRAHEQPSSRKASRDYQRPM